MDWKTTDAGAKPERQLTVHVLARMVSVQDTLYTVVFDVAGCALQLTAAVSEESEINHHHQADKKMNTDSYVAQRQSHTAQVPHNNDRGNS